MLNRTSLKAMKNGTTYERHKTNSAAYKDFKDDSKVETIDPPVDELIDIDSFRRKLEDGNTHQMLLTIFYQNRHIIKNQLEDKKYHDDKEQLRVYFLRHKVENWLMVGYTNTLERRLKEHERKGWEYLGDQVGTQQGLEKPLLDSIREAGFSSIPTSNEVFKITAPLIYFLIAKKCKGITEDLLQKDTQTSLIL